MVQLNHKGNKWDIILPYGGKDYIKGMYNPLYNIFTSIKGNNGARRPTRRTSKGRILEKSMERYKSCILVDIQEFADSFKVLLVYCVLASEKLGVWLADFFGITGPRYSDVEAIYQIRLAEV